MWTFERRNVRAARSDEYDVEQIGPMQVTGAPNSKRHAAEWCASTARHAAGRELRVHADRTVRSSGRAVHVVRTSKRLVLQLRRHRL